MIRPRAARFLSSLLLERRGALSAIATNNTGSSLSSSSLRWTSTITPTCSSSLSQAAAFCKETKRHPKIIIQPACLLAAAATAAFGLLSSKKNDNATTTTTQCGADQKQQQEVFRVKNVYELEQVLGKGAYGTVFQARRKKDAKRLALKAMHRRHTQRREFQREVGALQILASRGGGHEHLCRLYDLHEDDNNYYLAMELIQGGELLEHLIRNGIYSEAQAAEFVRMLAEGLAFCHLCGIIHADLKPENLMMSTVQVEGAQLKVVDFGCAVVQSSMSSSLPEKRSSSSSSSQKVVGTTAYWPPELFEKGSHHYPTPAADMWAAGCIVYILLTGTHPFDKRGDATDEEVERAIAKSKNTQYLEDAVFDERVHGLSQSSVDLLKRLLHPDPQERMTSDEFRRHPWVQGLTVSWEKMADSHRKLEAFWQKRFRAEILKKYAHATTGSSNKGTLSEKNLIEIFHSMDLDGNGVLEPNEIEVVLRELGVNDEDMSQIFDSVDLDGSGDIDLDEFRAIMRKAFDDGPGVRVYHHQQRFRSDIFKKYKNKAPSEDELREIFQSIDLDGNGILDPHEIRVVLRSAGEDEESIAQIIASIDLNRDGGVDWEEFREAMRNKMTAESKSQQHGL